ncbi:MAG: hypothetical protein K6E59_00655 [Bacilli bacterium]|nr:hypothetical protein [Bacilli bacterium]
MTIIQKVLLDKNLVCLSKKKNEDAKKCAYFNAFLLTNFGIEVTNPEFVDEHTVAFFNEVLHLRVPEPFYANPQDTKYFESEELLLEKVVSYYLGYGTALKRVELFQKALPREYVIGTEIHPRTYTIVEEGEVRDAIEGIACDYASYKRPFAEEEEVIFGYLYENGYYPKDGEIACRDNIFPLLEKHPELAKRLDKKDLVKLSHMFFGLRSKGLSRLSENSPHYQKKVEVLSSCLPFVRDCSLSKRQAKHFNVIVRMCTGKKGKEDHLDSPYRILHRHMRKGHTVSATKAIADRGSVLTRNLVYILSRVKDEKEAEEILSFVSDGNESVFLQLYRHLSDHGERGERTFIYPKIGKGKASSGSSLLHDFESIIQSPAPDGLAEIMERMKERAELAKQREQTRDERLYKPVLHVYNEREDQVRNRKSVLSDAMRKKVLSLIYQRLESHYSKLPSLGKIYVSKEFKNVAVPLNTSQMGKGLDILPPGSRIPFTSSFIRVFCHWAGIRDIDASIVAFKPIQKGKSRFHVDVFNWRNYHNFPLGKTVLCSGDDTSENGVEYQDLDLDGLERRGITYVAACINGYGGPFNKGEIYQGLQLKENLDTVPWDPKNIEFQMRIIGDTRAFVAFAVDLKKRELIIINQHCTGGTIVGDSQIRLAEAYLNDEAIRFNMHRLLSLMGEVVKNPEEADVVFDRDYVSTKEGQTVVRPYDVTALAAYVVRKNDKKE